MRPNDTNGTAADAGLAGGGDAELLQMWNQLATVLTACVLSFIIMATVIGKFCFKKVFVINTYSPGGKREHSFKCSSKSIAAISLG